MKFFEYLYYRMYEAYTMKNDSPVMRTSLYIAVLLFVLIILFLVFLERLLLIRDLYSKQEINIIKHSYFFWLIVFLFVFVITYYVFTKKPFLYYKERFSELHQLNKSIKVWMILNFPFLLLFTGLTVNILLFGGVIFGKEIVGLFSN